MSMIQILECPCLLTKTITKIMTMTTAAASGDNSDEYNDYAHLLIRIMADIDCWLLLIVL